MLFSQSVLDRFAEKVDLSDPDECWQWTAYVDPAGYGRFGVERKADYAHRVSFELLVGPIPDGLVIDHLCRNRACVNPDHLEPVTELQNIQRGYTARGIGPICNQCGTAKVTGSNGFRVCRHCQNNRAWERREEYKRKRSERG